MRSKLFFLVGFLVGAAMASCYPAYAVDHNNIDAGRPLDFDDAQSAAYGERSLEVGATVAKPSSNSIGFSGGAEYLQGFAKNSHFSLDFDPRYTSTNGQNRRFDSGDIGVGLFHSFNREVGHTPALAARLDAYLPTGRDASGVDFRLRGIASRQFRQYDQLHLNLDLGVSNDGDERQFQPGIILGYSHPLGLPTRFDRTLLAELGTHANPLRGQNPLTTLGFGIRQQVTVRSVLDLGVKTDVSGGANRQVFQLVAGYSSQF